MAKMIVSLAAAALLSALALPGTASAADKRADGLANAAPRATEFSSWHRRWHRPRVIRRHVYRYPRYRRWGPRYYAYAPYPYYRPYPYYYGGPAFYGPSFSFGFRF
jgi:Ni/Co efflux regulator RcnB